MSGTLFGRGSKIIRCALPNGHVKSYVALMIPQVRTGLAESLRVPGRSAPKPSRRGGSRTRPISTLGVVGGSPPIDQHDRLRAHHPGVVALWEGGYVPGMAV